MSIQVPLQKSRFHSSAVLPLFVLISFFIQFVLLFLIIFQGSQVNQLANSATKTMLQMVDGQVIQISSASACYRSPPVIQNLANSWALLNYTWSGKLTPTNAEEVKNPLKDPGVAVGTRKVPTSTANAAFLITDENDFRRKYLEKISAIVPSGVFQGYQETVLRVSQILSPKQLDACRWDVNLYGYMDILERGNSFGEPIAINQKITLRAVPSPNYPLPSNLSPLQQTIYRLGVAGLIIEKIEDLPNSN